MARLCNILRPLVLYSARAPYSTTARVATSVLGEDDQFAPSNPALPFVPLSTDASPEQVEQLAQFIGSKQRLVVITGAGCSTESGIPDYRSPNGSYARGHKPTTYQDFVKSRLARQRYWARSMLGWQLFASVNPNPTHTCLATLEMEGFVNSIITQNVDRLHHKAGSQHVIELHGHNSSVVCVSCKNEFSRYDFQEELQRMNTDWVRDHARATNLSAARPDGDVDLGQIDYSGFNLPTCKNCQSDMLKPTVVFFGENVPKVIVDDAMAKVNKADGILSIGSSLQVYSSFRFLKAANENNTPMAILNIGPTRADSLPNVKFKMDVRSGHILPMALSKIFNSQLY